MLQQTIAVHLLVQCSESLSMSNRRENFVKFFYLNSCINAVH